MVNGHDHDWICLSGPFPLPRESRRQRYVLNAACADCREPLELKFGLPWWWQAGYPTAARLAQIVRQEHGVRFASAAELIEYHAARGLTAR